MAAYLADGSTEIPYDGGLKFETFFYGDCGAFGLGSVPTQYDGNVHRYFEKVPGYLFTFDT